MLPFNLENIGLIITVSVVVFIVLFICYKISTALWKWWKKMKTHTNTITSDTQIIVSQEKNEDIAAIGMALHLYLNEYRDEESEIITIDMPSAHYSPWAQKHLVMKKVVRK